MTDAPAWDEAGLAARCADLRDSLLSLGHVSQADLADYWPGGAENHEAPPGNWIFCYAQLVRMLGWESPEASALERAAAEREVLAALRREPAHLELVQALPDGRSHLTVYPKSFHALLRLDEQDALLARLAEAAEQLRQGPASTLTERLGQVLEEIEYQQQVCVWILTTPGVGLPFGDADLRPVPPTWLAELDAADLVRVLRAHREVNGRRVAALSALIGRARKTVGRASWAVIGASAASELHTASYTLFRDWSLAEWMAQYHLTLDAKREAQESASAAQQAA